MTVETALHVGGRVKQIVEKKGLKKTEFASKIGHSEQSLHKIFSKEDLSTAVLKTICQALEITLTEFFNPFGTKLNVEGGKVKEPREKYAPDPCAGLKRENELLNTMVMSLDTNNKALLQAVDVYKALLKGHKIPAVEHTTKKSK